MSVSDQPKYSSDSFVLQTAGNRHVFRTVHLHWSVWRSVGYWHLTICYRPGPLAGLLLCTFGANQLWVDEDGGRYVTAGVRDCLSVLETGWGLGEERWDICLCQYAAERDSVEAQTSYSMLKCPWARDLTPNCSLRAGWHLAWQPIAVGVWMCVWMGEWEA